MPKMTIDGVDYEFKAGQTVLQLAHENGIDVPYFCYHPGLSIAGNCRMCLVEVEGQKKPDIACNMTCRDGLKVLTQTEGVKKMRAGVMEFLLLNHPLDCPVCDQAGECWLQEYYMDYARHPSALRDPKVEKRKVVPLGPQVMLDAERCILCTRCIRFLDEVTHTSELTIVDRGGHAEISLFPGGRLENLYSANVVDICPVGALTNRDFRFQQRVWFLKTTDSVCNVCSNGCNLHVDSNAVDRNVHRVRPRRNDAVNAFWMCDLGRTCHKPTHAETRIPQPTSGRRPATWRAAAADVAEATRRIVSQHGSEAIAVLASPHATNEALWALSRFADEVLRTPLIAVDVDPGMEETAQSDDLLLKADKTPNRSGLEAIVPARRATPFASIREGILAGRIRGLLALERDVVRLSKNPDEARELLSRLELLVSIASNRTETTELSHVVLPAATFLEIDGTFTNHAGHVQRLKPAFPPLHDSRPSWAILDFLAAAVRADGTGLGFRSAEAVFDELGRRVPAFGGLSFSKIAAGGAPLSSSAAAA